MSLNTSLAELGMDSMMSVEIKQTLEREFQIFLTAQEIRSLNFSNLQEITKSRLEAAEVVTQQILSENAESHILTGMKLVMRVISNRLSSEPYLRLSTRHEQGKDEILLVPGIEGMAQIFSVLVPKLRSPATCLQLGFTDHRHKTVFEMADYFLPVIVILLL